MTRTSLLACVGFALVACGPSHGGGDDDQGPHIEITPPDVTVTITNNVAVTQPYTATLVDGNGNRSDVTSTVVFTLANPAFGNWTGPTLAITGNGAGPTRVVATEGNVQSDTGLTVYVNGSRNDGTVPNNAAGLFTAATETPGHAPALAYPADGVLVPPNLGEFDVHWTDAASNNLFEISLQNTYVNLDIYSSATGASAFTSYTPDEWLTLASPSEPLTLAVAGLNTASPTIKGTSTTQTVNVTNEVVQGGLYYWTTTAPQGIFRYDMGTPGVAPASFFPPNMAPGGANNCVGCHSLSRDGTKIAMTIDGGDGRGAIFNVADLTVLVPFATNPQSWNFATFTPDASMLVTVKAGTMVLRSTNGGALVGTPLANSAGTVATHPELSPDGSQLASVETTQGGTDYDGTTGSIVLRSFDGNSTFGATTTLVHDATGASNFYPSWSPDGAWILFTRTDGNSYSNATAEVWVVKADGTLPPIQLAAADTMGTGLTNSWARWTPFQQTSGTNHDPVFYITFSSVRQFGIRPLTVGDYGPDKQIWMAPFYPEQGDRRHRSVGPRVPHAVPGLPDQQPHRAMDGRGRDRQEGRRLAAVAVRGRHRPGATQALALRVDERLHRADGVWAAVEHERREGPPVHRAHDLLVVVVRVRRLHHLDLGRVPGLVETQLERADEPRRWHLLELELRSVIGRDASLPTHELQLGRGHEHLVALQRDRRWRRLALVTLRPTARRCHDHDPRHALHR